MKLNKIIISSFIIIAIVVIIIVRLVSNKNSFEKELKMVSEFNTTIPVITDTVKYQQLATGFSVNGTFSPSQEISIIAETQGKVISISSEIGDKVITGQVMASIDNELLKSQLKLAQFNLEKAEKDMKRFEQLSKGDAVTIQQYEAAKQVFINAQSSFVAAKIQYDNSFIKAPFNGIVTKRNIEKGTWLSIGSPVFDIVDINKLKLIAKLTDDEITKVQKGQNVKISVETYPGIFYDGKISAIIIKADLSKHYDVEIEVNNRTDKLIKPGMYGTIVFASKSDKQTLIIPRKAIVGSIKNPEIFQVKGDSVILQKIEITPLDDKYVLVLKGLQAGDVIVTSGQINLVDGSKIKLND